MAGDDRTTTRDSFLNGAFHLWQPGHAGLRAGHDALLVAAAVPADAAGDAVDMGAGTGAVGFAAAVRAPGLRVVLAERERVPVDLLSRSVEDAPDSLGRRIGVVAIDLLEPRSRREAVGLDDGGFDWVLTNPPFHPSAGRRSPDPLRDTALAMPDETFLRRWLAVAAALLRHGGRLALIARPEVLSVLLQAAENRFGAVTVLPIHTRGRPAQRILVGAVRGSRAPLRIQPSFVLDEGAREALSGGGGVSGLFDP